MLGHFLAVTIVRHRSAPYFPPGERASQGMMTTWGGEAQDELQIHRAALSLTIPQSILLGADEVIE